MKMVRNPHRGRPTALVDAPFPSTNVAAVQKLLAHCPHADETPLVDAAALGPAGSLWVKDERARMGLGSFKALGAAYVIANDAAARAASPDSNTLAGETYVTASAGNHGLSVAAGARVFGAQAVVYIAETVPADFATRLGGLGAKVVRKGRDYAASMSAAASAADVSGWTLLSDSSWAGYTALPHRLMEGYLQMADEALRQLPSAPSHVFLQAGVGGLAGAVAAYIRATCGDAPFITVVEPAAAPALQASVVAGAPVFADGPDSIMGRLDCKEPSWIALNGLARDADAFLTLTDEEVNRHLPRIAEVGLATSASGGAGLAAAMTPEVLDQIACNGEGHVLCFLSEGPA